MLNKDGVRELAYVVYIDNIEPIEGSDNCEAAIVSGWKVMIRKDTFNVGDPAIYFEIDSKTPETEQFAFLAKKHYKVKTQKYTFGGKNPGFYSQGLLMAAQDFGWTVDRIDELFITDDEMVRHIPGTESAFLTQKLGVTYADPDDNKRKSSSSGDKYKKMAGRHPKLFSNPIIKWIYKKTWGKKLLFVFFGKRKQDDNKFPKHFEYIHPTDQERCLIGNTKIDTNRGKIRISDIVNKKMDVLVRSYNFETNSIEYKPIINYQKYDRNDDKIYNIEYSKNYIGNRKNRIICTGDHKVYTKNGYISASKIIKGDISYYIQYCYPNEIMQYVYGMYLGDGSISFDKRLTKTNKQALSPRLSYTQGEAHLNYITWLRNVFDSEKKLYFNDNKKSTYSGNPVYKFFVEIDETISKFLYEDGVINNHQETMVTKQLCDRLTPISLAIWYMDDGTLKYSKPSNSYTIELSTNAFDRKENDLLVNCLTKKFKIEHVSLRYDRNKGYFSICIGSKGVDQFLNIISKYIHPDMRYKLKDGVEYDSFELENICFIKENRLTENIIEDIKIIPEEEYDDWTVSQYVYDIEVADNHNFFANDILTHNCENMQWVLQDKTPYIITQKADGSSGTYILEKKHKLFKTEYEFYVCSRNVHLKSPDQNTYHDKNYYWEIAEKYNIRDKLKDYLDKHPDLEYVCWQGEICAPSIQKNPQHLKETHFYCFHMIDSKVGKYDIRDAQKIWKEYDMETVPILGEIVFPDDFEEFKKMADGYYDPSICEGQTNCSREGFVYYKTTDPNFSFKNVSREYLLKH